MYWLIFLVILFWAPKSQVHKPRVTKPQALKPRAPQSQSTKLHAIPSATAVAPPQIVRLHLDVVEKANVSVSIEEDVSDHTQLFTTEKARVSLLIEEDRKWRHETHNALVTSEGRLKRFYSLIVEGSNESLEPLNAASRIDTPDRRALKIVETNPRGIARKISIRYRPLRSSMEQGGIKGVGLKVLSHLQTAGHWAVAIGPYTYDIYQDNKRIMFNTGEWRMDRAGEKYLVKDRDVGSTSKTDTEIYNAARAVYKTMKQEPYDMKFNNCHRFVDLLTSRISNHKIANARLRFLYIWRLMPASWIFQAAEYVKQYAKVGKRLLLEKIVSEIEEHGFNRTVLLQAVKKQGLQASKLICFLLIGGPMNVFLIMAKGLLGWDPDVPEDRKKYLSFFKMIPGIDDAVAEHFLQFAFKGHKGVKMVMDKLIQETQDQKGVKKVMESLMQQSQLQVKKLASQAQNI